MTQVCHGVAVWCLQELVRGCLAGDPGKRPTAEGILLRVQVELAQHEERATGAAAA